MLKHILKHNNKTESIRFEQSRFDRETTHREKLMYNWIYSRRNNNRRKKRRKNQGNSQGNSQGNNRGNDVKTETE